MLDATGRCRGYKKLSVQLNKNMGCHLLMIEGIVAAVHD